MYFLNNEDGQLEIPDGNIITYKELEIVGQDKEYWNRPIQQNFVKIADWIKSILTTLSNKANKDLSNVTTVASTTANGLMSKEDKQFISGFGTMEDFNKGLIS